MNIKDITILIVAYKSDDILLKNLSNLKNFNIVIVDNYKRSKLKDKINFFSNISYLKQNNNLGESRAADIGLNHINTKYTLYLNPDTLIDEINIRKLKKVFLSYSDIGILSPLHLNQKNEYIGNYFLHPFYQKIDRNDLQKKVLRSLDSVKPVGDFFPRCVWGAPLFFNTHLIKKNGFFDTDFFLFFEDVDLCDRIIKNKLKIMITAESFCYHLNPNYSSNSINYLYFTSSNFIFSQMLYFKKNKKSLHRFYLRGFEYFFNSFLYLIKFNKNKFFQNIFRIAGIFKFIFFMIYRKIKF